jgi:tRNA threonylcarbamoyl adenosine modification protein (Sua5/YciO/YrdC/YwlC family)
MGPALADAVRALAAGRLVVYPTDTLLGLGALATDSDAVARLANAKGRPPGMPLSVALSSTEELEALAELSPMGRRFVRTHLPGPYTLLARPTALARRTLAAEIAGPHGTIGVRVPDHPLARELARRVGPLTATSANRHGEAPCRTLSEARRTFGSSVAVYLPGEPRPSGRPSELVDLTHGSPHRVARRGRA